MADLRCFGGGWYVGNTAPGEWIQYTNIWLSAGSYRFTANAGSPLGGATMHLEVDGVNIRPGVGVPNTGRVDSFGLVHLGTANLSQGYHTLRIVFETSGISLDWVILRKDGDTTSILKASDTVLVRPSTSGMLIAPIVSFNQQSEHNSLFNANDASSIFGAYPQKDANGQPYSDYQLRNWYRAPMFQDFDRRTDRYWDIMVDQLMASRAQVPLIHCRGTIDFTHDLQDRGYVGGDGAFEGRWLKKFVEAVARNPQAASSLQIGMFFEDGPVADDYFKTYGSYPSWGSSAFSDYVMQYWLNPWFDNVPASLLYQPFPLRPIINIWTAHPGNMVQDGNMALFLTNVRNRMIARYGLNPLFIISPDSDTNAQAQAWGVAPWYVWGGALYTSRVFTDGTRWGFSSCGSRKRIDTVWANDWDPVTNTGTPAGSDAGDPDYQSPLDTNGNSTLLNFYAQASAANTRLIHQEGFFNIPEGSPIFASCAPGWNFPNQHLAAMRQYADPTTESLMFEAESCDSYYKTTLHENLGGSYRRQWYSTTGLDVYRPLHNLSAWTNKSIGPGNLVELSAGFFDVWALDSVGHVWAHIISDGAPDTWTSVSMNGISKFTCLSVGKHHAWAINGTSVYTCKLPYGWAAQDHTTWTLQSGNMVQLAVNAADVWALDAGGLIYRRRVNELDAPGDVWTRVPGPAMDKISTGGNFIWGVSGTNIYHSLTTNVSWTQVSNSENITQISVGSEEVWGINAAGNVFRRSASGIGGWDSIDGNLAKIAVGENYAWGLSGSTPSSRKLDGFLGAAVATVPATPTGLATTAGNSSAKLTWAPVLGAAGYNVKRATASAGPYMNAVISATTNAVDTDLVNGTTYYYVITAFNGTGESPGSTEISLTPTATGTPPVAPTGLTAIAGNTQITLSWIASFGATSYNVKRAIAYGGPFTIVATGVTATNYTDVGLAPDNAYTYVVSAVNAAGESLTDSASASAAPTGILLGRTGWVASASVNSGNAGRAIDGNISTRWDTSGAQTPGQWFQVDMGSVKSFYKLILDATPSLNDYPRGYQVNVSNDGVNWGNPVATGVASSAVTTIKFATQTARYIRITQTGSVGNYWSIHEFNVYAMPPPPPVPTGLIATATSPGQINLSWNASSGANSYNVKRSTANGGPYSTIATGLTDTNYSDMGLSASTTCYYVVSAMGSGGESANSPQASATTQAPLPPPSIVILISDDTLTLSWPADCLGWRLQVQTNAPGGGLTTNWVAVPGSELVTSTNISINPARVATFYRLIHP
ncbi:DUF5010 domain-containing protein [Pedosphaera parvula]|uniref:DUF5010 domain-containing protein n=1 Tax=Pedosphaera parvula TaxID=1032527 RepID=UPI00135F1478|nr:DUF5010 domain-containing protein [Pedosphaera parvula]